MDKKNLIIIGVVAIAALMILLFVVIKFVLGTKGTCECPMYSMPRPCGNEEQPLTNEPFKLHWYCKDACTRPPSCS
jgi:hypothetical protein